MEVVEKARKRIIEMKSEIAELERFIELYDVLGNEDSKKSVDKSPDKPKGGRDPRNSKPSELVRVAYQAIIEKGRPMNRSELVNDLENKELIIGGSDKSKNMGTIMWRSKKFDNIDGLGYWPKGVPIPK